jgi:hypothetical protein
MQGPLCGCIFTAALLALCYCSRTHSNQSVPRHPAQLHLTQSWFDLSSSLTDPHTSCYDVGMSNPSTLYISCLTHNLPQFYIPNKDVGNKDNSEDWRSMCTTPSNSLSPLLTSPSSPRLQPPHTARPPPARNTANPLLKTHRPHRPRRLRRLRAEHRPAPPSPRHHRPLLHP